MRNRTEEGGAARAPDVPGNVGSSLIASVSAGGAMGTAGGTRLGWAEAGCEILGGSEVLWDELIPKLVGEIAGESRTMLAGGFGGGVGAFTGYDAPEVDFCVSSAEEASLVASKRSLFEMLSWRRQSWWYLVQASYLIRKRTTSHEIIVRFWEENSDWKIYIQKKKKKE